tara:strand:+ start:837 stop:1037 length:201 start_codon:yes stop_codon:yes gene_type:complete
MNFIHHIKRAMRRLTPAEMAAAELADAELHRLEAHTAMEYASSVVSYEDARIKRLRKFLADAEKQA